MHVATSIVLHRISTFDKSIKTTRLVGLGLSILIAAFLTYHYFMDDFTVHAILFASMVWYTGFKTRHVIQDRFNDDEHMRERCSRLAVIGISEYLFFATISISLMPTVSFLTGYGIWNLDFVLCSELTHWKRVIGMPWSFVLEFHGWWHALTCFGAYICMALVEVITQEEKVKNQNRGYLWPAASYLLLNDGKSKKKDN